MGGRIAAAELEESDPMLAWSLRAAAREVIMGDMERARRGSG